MNERAPLRGLSPRSLVHRELATSDRFRTVSEIHRSLAGQRRRPSLSTVYRTLTALAGSGLAETVHLPASGIAYRLRPGQGRGPYLVCMRCGAATAVPLADLAPWFRTVAEQQGFTGVEARVELWGRCGSCRNTVNENGSHS
ncbi:transcriptional repressor [Promicromonospora sp. NPDC023987]|uniref:Fur family transcriptional regulator n=1 Tax=Promicromonospora sp. NPDC023987 TaxID=3155360 RepID=UPI0033D1EAD9